MFCSFFPPTDGSLRILVLLPEVPTGGSLDPSSLRVYIARFLRATRSGDQRHRVLDRIPDQRRTV